MDHLIESAVGNLLGGVGAAAFAWIATIGLNEMHAATVRESLRRDYRITPSHMTIEGLA